LLGTRATAAVAGVPAAVAERVELAMFDSAARLESIFTVFDEGSGLHAFRRMGTTDVPELIEVLASAERWVAETGGAFCPTMAPLMQLWAEAEARDVRPTAAELAAATAAAQAGRPEHLDLNAVAKGWIADRAVADALSILTEATAEAVSETQADGTQDPGVPTAWLSLGGDLVHRGSGTVAVGIEDPRRPYDNVPPLATIEVANEAVATSGGGRRWWTIDGVRHSRVVDPRTGEPTHTMLSATVVASTAAVADVLATTALILGPDDAGDLVGREGGEFLFVLTDGSVAASSGRFRRG